MTADVASRPADAPENRRFYGRRHGRKMRRRASALLEALLPRIQVDLSGDAPVDPQALFGPGIEDVWLEVGFGGGEHLASWAERRPDIGFIGCEPFVNGVASLLRHVEEKGLERNVRIQPDDARPLLERLPDASLGRCFVLFPDPWPKARHHERRFIGPPNLDRLARILRDGAELRMASDVPDLVEWMDAHASAHPAFERASPSGEAEKARPDDWPPTRYEAKAIAQGRTPVYMIFRRRPR